MSGLIVAFSALSFLILSLSLLLTLIQLTYNSYILTTDEWHVANEEAAGKYPFFSSKHTQNLTR